MATTWLGFSIAVGLVLVLTPPAWADFQAGLEAADRGDYHTAVKEFQLSAERGDVKARYNLGVMYQLGLGVPQDDQEAVRWFRKAAEQGYATAESVLGSMYYEGRWGAPQDYVLARVWLTLAAEQGSEKAADLRDFLEEEMTLDQLAEAQRLVREWKANRK